MDVRNLSNLSNGDRQIRMNIRNFFLTTTREELVKALDNYPDKFSKDCIRELIDEHDEETKRDTR